MLRTRIWVGTLLALGIGGVLLGDGYLQPLSPILFATVIALSLSGTRELWRMLPEKDRPRFPVVVTFVVLILIANWSWRLELPQWPSILFAFVLGAMGCVLWEIFTYTNDGHSLRRLAFALLMLFYFGVLPSFLVQLRWQRPEVATLALATAIFVPKVCDIFALFTGMAFGKHKFTPTLSPKKTWEGFFGGLVAAIVLALIVHHFEPRLFRLGLSQAIAFGFFVGLAGVFGDLAESMMKRDCQLKDASNRIPGFGGVMDVIDSVIFAAPVAYVLFMI
jgi:phosphatidate cytidylyltransferase